MGIAPWVCCPQKQSGDRWHCLSPSSSEPGAWEPETGSFPAKTPDARSSGAPSMSGNRRWRAGLRVSSQPGPVSLEKADKDPSAFPGRPLTLAPRCPRAMVQTWVGVLQPSPPRSGSRGHRLGLLLPGLPRPPVPGAHLAAEFADQLARAASAGQTPGDSPGPRGPSGRSWAECNACWLLRGWVSPGFSFPYIFIL